MKASVRFLIVLAVASCAILPLAAAPAAGSAPKAGTPVDFSVTIADLHRAAESGDDKFIPGDRALVIDGEIGAVTARVDTDDRFTAEVELIGGAWRGEDGVDLYRAYAIFDGTRFRDLFSRRSQSRLITGDKILVLCKYLGIGIDYDEKTPVAVLEAIDLRKVD